MAQMTFQTQNEQFRALIGNGMTYSVPPFQRDYSWSEEEWRDLWDDVLETVRDGGEPAHYMGYLVLQSTGEQSRQIIDGQQRLTTLSLIVLAGLKHLQRLIDAGDDAQRNLLRLEQVRNTYIGYRDPVSLNVVPKLTLNRHNDTYFQTYIVSMTSPLPLRGFNASEMAMRQAFEWFDASLRAYVNPAADKGAAIAAFIENMSLRLIFTVITVTDELNAYRVFETLNARGVQLSSTDLLKNYLFSVLHRDKVHDRDLERLDERWAAIVDRLGNERFTTYLRVHWNSRRGDRVRESELFKVVRRTVTQASEVFTLLADIEADLDTYLLLTTDQSHGLSRDAAVAVGELRLFRVRQPVSMLLASRRILDDHGFATVLRATAVMAFRYNIIGSQATGDQETAFTSIVRRILNGEITRADGVIRALAPVYPADSQFRENFSQKVIRTGQGGSRRLVRYILSRIERQAAGHVYNELSDRYSIEHVLPERPEEGWDQFDDRTHEQFVYRLGNMTLLEASANRDLGRAPYHQKRMSYAESSVACTRRIAEEFGSWTPESIGQNQQWMAKQAVAIWRVDQLSER